MITLNKVLGTASIPEGALGPFPVPIALDPAVYAGRSVVGTDGNLYFSTGVVWTTPSGAGGPGITVSDTATVDLTLTGSDLSADVIEAGLNPQNMSSGAALNGEVPTADGAGGISWEVPSGAGITVSDTTTVDLTLTGSDLTADVLEAGLDPANMGSGAAADGAVATADGAGSISWLMPSETARVAFVAYPASETAPGLQGQMAWDGENLAVCVATNTWVFLYPARVAP